MPAPLPVNERPPAVLWQCLRGREENGEERGGNCQYGTPLAPLSSFNHLVHPAVRVPTQHPSLTPVSDPESDMTCARSQQIRRRRSRSSGTRSIARPPAERGRGEEIGDCTDRVGSPALLAKEGPLFSRDSNAGNGNPGSNLGSGFDV